MYIVPCVKAGYFVEYLERYMQVTQKTDTIVTIKLNPNELTEIYMFIDKALTRGVKPGAAVADLHDNLYEIYRNL